MNNQLEGVIFDVDGTLVASNDAHAEAWVEAFATFGYEDVSFDRVRPLIGMGGDRLREVLSLRVGAQSIAPVQEC
jgi:beta-phosphoglucomutase-like phosphatase (HAD superfamily)